MLDQESRMLREAVSFCSLAKMPKVPKEKELIVNVEVKTEGAQLSEDEKNDDFLIKICMR